jgi:hypothetical protein
MSLANALTAVEFGRVPSKTAQEASRDRVEEAIQHADSAVSHGHVQTIQPSAELVVNRDRARMDILAQDDKTVNAVEEIHLPPTLTTKKWRTSLHQLLINQIHQRINKIQLLLNRLLQPLEDDEMFDDPQEIHQQQRINHLPPSREAHLAQVLEEEPAVHLDPPHVVLLTFQQPQCLH